MAEIMAFISEGPGWLINLIEKRAIIELRAEKLGLSHLLENRPLTEKPLWKELQKLPENYMIIRIYPNGLEIAETYIDGELKKRKCLICGAEIGPGHNCLETNVSYESTQADIDQGTTYIKPAIPGMRVGDNIFNYPFSNN